MMRVPTTRYITLVAVFMRRVLQRVMVPQLSRPAITKFSSLEFRAEFSDFDRKNLPEADFVVNLILVIWRIARSTSEIVSRLNNIYRQPINTSLNCIAFCSAITECRFIKMERSASEKCEQRFVHLLHNL